MEKPTTTTPVAENKNKSRTKSTSVSWTRNSFVDFVIGVSKLAKGAQFYWFFSLICTIHFSCMCIISSYWNGSDHAATIHYYSYALGYIMTTYILVLRQVYHYTPFVYLLSLIYNSIKQLLSSKDRRKVEEQRFRAGMEQDVSSNRNSHGRGKDLNNMLRNENVQYLLFAFLHWIFSSSYYGAINPSVLYPYTIYAIFHCVNYTRQHLIPILPNLTPLVKQTWCQNLGTFHQNFNNKSRMMASNTEIMLATFYVIPLFKIFFRLMIGRFLRSNPHQVWIDFKILFLFLVTINFLSLRNSVDQYTRAQISQYDVSINNILWNPIVPEALRQALVSIKYCISFVIDKLTLVV